MSKKNSIPRNEYPRPQMIREEWMILNGVWDFEIDNELSGEQRGLAASADFTKKILVPFCPESSLSMIENKDFMNSVWYKRSFTIPKKWTGKRIFIHFGAVDYETSVWLNGVKIGVHKGGYSSFSFEITPYLKQGENTIILRAIDDTRSGLQPTGKQSPQYNSFGCFYTRTTGIWQTVWLEAVPQTFIKSLRYFPDAQNKKINIELKIDGDIAGAKLNIKALLENNSVGEISAAVSENMLVSLPLKKIKLWHPGDPNLYDTEFSLCTKNGETDFVKSYFGLRDICIQGKRVLINGKSVFQRLILDQGFYPDGIYTAPSDAALKNDIELSMAMGFNGARLHQKVFEPRFLYYADKMGYLVWGEYPNWGLDHAAHKTLESVLPEWLEVIERDFNHPSIIGWCPFNETTINQNPELLRIIFRATKQYDPTRPVIDTSGYVHVETDIYDSHNYEQNPADFKAAFETYKDGKDVWKNFPDNDAKYSGQPYFVSEYGGIWWNPGQQDEKAWGYGNRPKTEKEFIERYKGLTEILLFDKNMFGFCYTQLTDVEQEVNGLYTYSRKPKFSPKLIKEINIQKAAIEEE